MALMPVPFCHMNSIVVMIMRRNRKLLPSTWRNGAQNPVPTAVRSCSTWMSISLTSLMMYGSSGASLRIKQRFLIASSRRLRAMSHRGDSRTKKGIPRANKPPGMSLREEADVYQFGSCRSRYRDTEEDLLDCEGNEPLLARSCDVLRNTVVDPEPDEATDCKTSGAASAADSP